MKYINTILRMTRSGATKSLSASISKRKDLMDWWDSKPKPITLFPGEKEIFREGPVLVTDTRISHIDPFDRVLKTYMFEHMISLNKDFYHASARTHRLCIGLITLASLILLFTLFIDLVDEEARRFAPVYIPLLISLIVGLIVWRDMRPKYRIEWSMRDGNTGGIKTEPLLREWLVNNNKREQFMNKLVEAMNMAIAGKAWWPNRETLDQLSDNSQSTDSSITTEDADEENAATFRDSKSKLKLVTDNYQ